MNSSGHLEGPVSDDHSENISLIAKVPEHLLERSRLARARLEAAKQQPDESAAAAQIATNGLLSVGLSEKFNDCSIAAATACQNAHERIAESTTVEELVFLGEEGSHSIMATRNLTDYFALDDDRTMRLALGRSQKDPEAPLYLLAITRGDLALRIASFQRRQSSLLCDFVQLDGEMTDDSFIVTPADEQGSRLDIVESIRHLTTMHPVDLTAAGIGAMTYYSEYCLVDGFGNGPESSTIWRKARLLGGFIALRSLVHRGIVDPKYQLGDMEWAVRRINPSPKKMAKQTKKINNVITAELTNNTGSPHHIITSNRARWTPKFWLANDDGAWIHEAIQKYRNQEADIEAARKVVASLGVNTAMEEILGSTNAQYEELFKQEYLPRLAVSGSARGVRRDVSVGKTASNTEFELSAEPLGKSGYRLIVRGRPSSMPDRQFEHLHTVDLYRDRFPGEATIDAAPDILDLLQHANYS